MTEKARRDSLQNSVSQKQRRKRKERESDDIIDCQSINEMNYFCEPKVESGKVDPYASVIGSPKTERSENYISFQEEKAILSKRPDASTQLNLQEVIDDNFEPKKFAKNKQISEKGLSQSNNTAEWNVISKFEEYSNSLARTKSQRAHATLKRHNLNPSPLAKNVGNILQNLGYVSVDFFIHLCRLTSDAGSYQAPIGVLMILACLYFSLMYVEISLANSAEIALEWLWPTVHMTLRFVEQILRSATNFVQSLDEMGESIVCDWAHLWCVQFDLMCHKRCSFTTKTLEKFRQV